MATYQILLDGNAYDPTNFGDVSIELNLSTDFGGYFFRRKIGDNLTFRKAAYSYILGQINIDQCQEVLVEVQQFCSGAWVTILSGFFTRQNAKIAYDKCYIEVEVTTTDEYSCILENGKEEVNFLGADVLVLPPQDIQYTPTYGLQAVTVSGAPIPPTGYGPTFYAFVSPFWVFVRYVVRTRCVAGIPQEPAPAFTAWTLLQDDCNVDGTATWWRMVLPDEITLSFTTTTCVDFTPCTPPSCGLFCIDLGVRQTVFTPPFQYERLCACPLPTQFTIPNTRFLPDTIDYILSQVCPTLTLESELLTNETNYVTGSTENPLTDLHIAQKSDVVNPTATEWATNGSISIVNLLDDLCKLLNSMWYVDSGTNKLVFEHVSAILSNVIGIDLTTLDGGKWDAGRNTVSFDKDQVPTEETFTYANNANEIDFVGLPISYNTQCSNGNTQETRTQYIETELVRIFQNTNEGLTGFVLLAIESILQDDAKSEVGELSQLFIPNAPLSWANLHRDYFEYYRFLNNGTLNGSPTAFVSTRPVKKQENIVFPLCCLNDFNPLELVKTSIGNGRVQNAIYNPASQKIELTLKFED